jgi:transposase InsO family protein
MSDRRRGTLHDRWAELRFAIVGPLLASPPPRGELVLELDALSKRVWVHPATGEPVSFEAPTIERWYYKARNAGVDRVGALRKKIRKDAGTHPSMTPPLRSALRAQYESHPTWSYQLHADNLEVVCEEEGPSLGECPSYSTLLRYMKDAGLLRRPRAPNPNRPGAERARARLEASEVRSYEATHVHGLWHSDFHFGSRKVLTRAGTREVPKLLGVLDDLSRVGCHAQWYLDEEAESFAHGLCQGFQKRDLPSALMTDGGSAMKAGETQAGLSDLSIVWSPTLEYSPYQNGKQEVFWAQIEGRLLPMLEGVPELTLSVLNEATQAWLELEYNRETHSEIGMSPVARMLAGPSVGRPCPGADELRRAFRLRETRTQRRSDGTVSIEGVRFEVPSRLRHVERLEVRYARWDLSAVDVVDAKTRVIIATMYPLDKQRNADGLRRALEPVPGSPTPAPKPAGMAPLLRKLVDSYRATGLPPAYLPKHDVAERSDDDHDDDEEKFR